MLEDGSLRRVGSAFERRVNVRIIAATNRDLEQEVRQGRFREDLFYRINVMSLVLPRLRERADDISLLIQHFLPQGWRITDGARAALEKYHWPGNVRQLSNVIERATILADEQLVTINDLPRDVLGTSHHRDHSPVHPGRSPIASSAEESPETGLDAMERAHVLEVLHNCQGNKARAARALGIHRRRLYRLLERYSHGTEKHADGAQTPADK